MLAPTHLEAGQVLARDFRVLKPLAAGGMGSVYLVEQLSTGRQRALKVMHPQLARDAESRGRFQQEARVGARIRSEHVVEVVSAGIDDDTGIPWLAMELLDGEELAQRMKRQGRLAPDEVLEVFRQLCHGLGEAHRAGLVHRDLKPENIFIATSRRQDVPFTVKILDFGVAKLVQEVQGGGDGTRPVGTPRWMAPEQSDTTAHILPATDVWALGLIAFHLLTGRSYWRAIERGANFTALMRELVFEPIESASERATELQLAPALPAGFDAWFARCVVREQEKRYPDATAALAGLEPLLKNAHFWGGDPATTSDPLFLARNQPPDEGANEATLGGPAAAATRQGRAPTPANRGTGPSQLPIDPDAMTSNEDMLPTDQAMARVPLPKKAPTASGTQSFAKPLPAQAPPMPVQGRSPTAPQRAPTAPPGRSPTMPQRSPTGAGRSPTGAGRSPTGPARPPEPPLRSSELTPEEAAAESAPLEPEYESAQIHPVAPAPAAPAPKASNKLVPIGIGAAVIVIAGLAFALKPKPAPPAPAPVVPAPVVQQPPKPAESGVPGLPATFVLYIDSLPTSADVMEGDSKLGVTPMQLSLLNSDLRLKARSFRIEKQGYKPYSLVQGPAPESVRFVAPLIADEAPPPEKKDAPDAKRPKTKEQKPDDSALRLRR